MSHAPVIEAVSRLCLQPGDTLVARVDRPLHAEQRDALKAMLGHYFPEHGPVLVLDGGLTLEVVEDGAATLSLIRRAVADGEPIETIAQILAVRRGA